jgi:hypothetical protein
MRIEWVALHEVRRWPRNPKDHDLPAIRSSFARFGWVEPLVLDEATGQLVAGHGRLEAAQESKAAGAALPARTRLGAGGEWLVPVLRGVAFKSPDEAEAYLLASNRLVEAGGWDDRGLRDQLQRLASREVNLAGLGWGDEELRCLLEEAPDFQPGDGEQPRLDQTLARTVKCPGCGLEIKL